VTRALIYARISVEREGAETVSVDRQETLCRAAAAAREFEVVGYERDIGRSGFKRGVKREGWERIRKAIERGEADVLMAYSLSRIGRRVKDLLDLTEFLDEHGVKLVIVDQAIDTTTPAGQLFYTVIAAINEMQSAQTRALVQSAVKVSAEAGEMRTGGRRQFGYTADRSAEIIESEAAVIRECVDRLLAGESVRSLARELNARGVVTSTGGQWAGQTLSQMLRSPRPAGMRIYKGQLIQGKWEPIVSVDRWTELVQNLDGRSRSSGIGTPAHLLTGLIVCGRCGENLFAHFSSAAGRKPQDQYSCMKRPGSERCGRLAGSKSTIDAYVVDALFEGLSLAELVPTDTGDSLGSIEAEIASLGAKRTEFRRLRYVEDKLTEAEFDEFDSEASERLLDLEAARVVAAGRQTEQDQLLRPGKREDLEAWWDRATLDERRRALRRAISSITLQPAKVRGGNVFDTSRIQIEWTWQTNAAWYRVDEDRFEEYTVWARTPAGRSDIAARNRALGESLAS
jgi:site-specific DNA recombinase